MAVQLGKGNSPSHPPRPRGAAAAVHDAGAEPPAQVAPPLDPNDGDEARIEPHVGFWQEPWVQNALPLVTSLVLHITIIVLGFLLIEPYVRNEVSQEQVIVPDVSTVDGDVGGIPNPGLGGDPTRPAQSDLVPENTRSDGWNKLPSKSLQAAVLGGSGETPNDSMIGIGANASLGRGAGVGVGSGDGQGAAAPFGVPGGGLGAGPRFMGLGGGSGVKTVAYVCDASGSMMGLPLELLKIELQKAVKILTPVQAFNVVFFRKDAYALSPQGMLPANPANKAKAYGWLNDVDLGAETNPIPGLRLIFAQRPQLIYVLTDGAFDDNRAVIAEIRRLNAQKQTRINTIAFFSPDEQESKRKACEAVLRTIAEENGGKFKVVLTTDLTK